MEEEISLRELIEVMLAGKWVIILITIVAMVLSLVVSLVYLNLHMKRNSACCQSD